MIHIRLSRSSFPGDMNEPLHLKVHISELSWLDSSLGMLDKDAKTFVTEHLSKVNAEMFVWH